MSQNAWSEQADAHSIINVCTTQLTVLSVKTHKAFGSHSHRHYDEEKPDYTM